MADGSMHQAEAIYLYYSTSRSNIGGHSKALYPYSELFIKNLIVLILCQSINSHPTIMVRYQDVIILFISKSVSLYVVIKLAVLSCARAHTHTHTHTHTHRSKLYSLIYMLSSSSSHKFRLHTHMRVRQNIPFPEFQVASSMATIHWPQSPWQQESALLTLFLLTNFLFVSDVSVPVSPSSSHQLPDFPLIWSFCGEDVSQKPST